MNEGTHELHRNLVERITDGSITAEELKASIIGDAEREAIRGYVQWMIDEENYRLKDEGAGLEAGSDSLREEIKKSVKKQLERKGWSGVSGIDWDGLIDELA